MYHLIFTLSMPRKGSWNNKWSGDSEKFVKARSFYKKEFDKIPDIVGKHHEYRWDDGWTAVVDVQLVKTAAEKNRMIKNSAGFFGYDWMIKSLIKHGKIICDSE